MGATRQSRIVKKAEAPTVRLQERDRWILDALAKCRFLTTRQLARLFFTGSTSATNKRLRRLLDCGLVKVWMRRLDEQNIYSITAQGTDESGTTDRAIPRGLDQVEHVLLINNIRIEFSLRLEDLNGALTRWQSDWELRVSAKSVIPDSVFTVRWPPDAETTFYLEADNNTRSPRAFVQKCLRYARTVGGRSLAHTSACHVLVVSRDAIWSQRYRNAAGASRLSLPIWFTSLGLLQQGFCEAIWKNIRGEEHSLRNLICQPYGKEGLAFGSVSFDEASNEKEARI